MKNKYKIINNIVEIYINSKFGEYVTIIDIDDFNLVNNYKTSWCINYKNGRIDGVRTKVQKDGIRKQVWMHRIIINCNSQKVVDHIDGNTLNNRKCNLREVTSKENMTNLSSSSNSKTKYRDIYFEKEKYSVRIKGKRFGRYNTLKEALICRDNEIKNIFPLRNRID